MVDTYDFGKAVFAIEGENRQFVDTLKSSEQHATKSLGKISGSFGKVNVSAQSVGQTFGILGPAAGVMGGQFGQALGPIAGMGSALAGVGTAMLGLPGLALAAVAAIGLLVSQIQKQRREAREALEETKRAIEEALALRQKAEAADVKAALGGKRSLVGSRRKAEQERAAASFQRQEITARTEADRQRVTTAKSVYAIEQKIIAAHTADRKLSRDYRDLVQDTSPSSVLSKSKRKALDNEYKYAKSKQSALITELEHLRSATHKAGVAKAAKIESDAQKKKAAELEALRAAGRAEHKKKVDAMFPAAERLAMWEPGAAPEVQSGRSGLASTYAFSGVGRTPPKFASGGSKANLESELLRYLQNANSGQGIKVRSKGMN